MSPAVQAASIAAWQDEEHVRRQPPRCTARSSTAVVPLLGGGDGLGAAPEAGFYLWLPVPGGDDEPFTWRLTTNSI